VGIKAILHGPNGAVLNPTLPIFRRSRTLALLLVLLGQAFVPVFATPANKKALAKVFGPHLPAQRDTCATCHVAAEAHGAESLEDFPHNAFGKALHSLDGPIRDRIGIALDEDSDGDGITNRDEILLGLPPGTPNQQGQVVDSTLLREKNETFASWQKRYPWEPFAPVIRPTVPVPENGDWGTNAIDAFLAESHRAQGLKPRPEAPPEVWLRRVSLNLTGLLPRTEEIVAFRKSYSEAPQQAREEVVDRLLTSPQYGERWARHWMDVWRYSDWSGYKDAVRVSQPHIWRWRDWIVESLNEDKGYDQMILEMLAADEAMPTDENSLRATGFLVRNHDVGSRDVWLDNVVSHTSQAFLGITMGCVKCHDHMYDPIPMEEYYSMRAIFEGYHVRTDRVPGQLDPKKEGLVRAYARTLAPKTYLFERGDERFPVKDKPIPPAVPAVLGGTFDIEEIQLPREAWQPWRRDFVRREMKEEKLAAIESARERLAKQQASGPAKPTSPEVKREAELGLAKVEAKLAALEAEFLAEDREEDLGRESEEWIAAARSTLTLQREANLIEAQWKKQKGENALSSGEAALQTAKEKKDNTKEAAAKKKIAAAKKEIGDAEKAIAAAEKAKKKEVTTKFTERQKSHPNRSNGRRLAFARWLTEKRNPLTARVAVNHVWLRHFGQALVPTVNEFGANGREPLHPALVDWLAAEFMESGWSLQALHRKIVLSSAYRMSGSPEAENLARDPDNLYYWRMPSRRMEGEIVRDNLLWVSGKLDTTMGGPEIPQGEAMKTPRRSLYFRHAHEKLVEFVQIFDGPKVSECYQRVESVQPHQALALHNNPLTEASASALAEELAEQAKGDSRRFIDLAFFSLLGREAKPEEITLCEEFLTDSESGSDNANPERARKRLLTVLLNHNDFITIR